MTFALPGATGSYSLVPPSRDPFLHQELIEILYHTLWETVHVFFEHRELGQDAGDAAFLYPFLGEAKQATGDIVDQVAASIRAKAQDDAQLRARVAREEAEQIATTARAINDRLLRGGKLILFGNGGSATDANDWALDCVQPPAGYKPIPAISLSLEPANITAIANDVGVELIYMRQLIAHARPEDVAIGISTSGGSRNIIAALEEARKSRTADCRVTGHRRRRDPAPRTRGLQPGSALGLHSAHSGSAGVDLSRAPRNAGGAGPCLNSNSSEHRVVPTRTKCASGWNGEATNTWNTMSKPMPSARARMIAISGGQRTVPILAEDGDVVQIGWQGRGCVVAA